MHSDVLRPTSPVAIVALAFSLGAGLLAAPQKPAAQKPDEEYTKLIRQYLQDPRITT